MTSTSTERQHARPDLDRFFHPRRVAVVGASDRPGTPQAGAWRLLRDWATRAGAAIHPVNPHRDIVDGLPCVARLTDLDEPVDVAAVLVGRPESTIRDAADTGVAFVVVFSAGYAETGEDGSASQAALAEIVRGTDTRLLGPNTNLNAFEAFRGDLDGDAIAIISQSGHQGRPIFMLQDVGVRVSYWAPTGNEADLGAADFVGWFAEQPEIGVVAAYLEGIADGRRFLDACDDARHEGTAIVAVKVGRTEAGRSGVSSHTGHLAGSDRVVDGAFAQHDVIRVDDLEQLGATATLLARAGAPRTSGIAVYSISGGTGAHLADLFEAAGVHLPPLAATTQDALHDWIPPYLSVANPVDCGGHPVGDARGRKILDAIVADPAVGALVVPITAPFPPLSDRLAADLADLAAHTDVPICVIWGSPVGTEPALTEVLRSSEHLTVFRSARTCVAAVADWLRWHGRRSRQRPRRPRRRSVTAPKALAVVERILAGIPGAAAGEPVSLSEAESLELVGTYGIPTARAVLARTSAEAIQAAAAAPGPVVLKACGRDVQHKSDLGLVIAGLDGARDVAAAHRRIQERATSAGLRLDGVLVAEQADPGVELVGGIVRDEVFGPVVMVGSGGVAVEVLDDVAFRVPPITRDDAREMLDGLRGAPLLRGVRGQPAANRDAIVDAIVAIGRLAMDLDGHLVELDVNPLLARPDGVVALDALVTWQP